MARAGNPPRPRPPAPPALECGEQVFCLDCHPVEPVVAAGLLSGPVQIFRYMDGVRLPQEDAEEEEEEEKEEEKDEQQGRKRKRTRRRKEERRPGRATREHHDPNVVLEPHRTQSVRAVVLSQDCRTLLSASSDRSVVQSDLETGRELWRNTHGAPINRMLEMDATAGASALVATGDDDGVVRVWDTRIAADQKASRVVQFKKCDDYISGFAYDDERHTLLFTAGDRITACDVRQRATLARSDEQEEELLCIELAKNGQKAVVGTSEGTLLLFSWDQWGDCSDRFPCHKESVECILPISDDAVLTGCSDGRIRAVHLLPDAVLGVLGDQRGQPVEGMQFTHDLGLVASFAHDNKLRFWDATPLAALQMAGDDEGQEGKETSQERVDSDDEQEQEQEQEEDADGDEDEDEDGDEEGQDKHEHEREKEQQRAHDGDDSEFSSEQEDEEDDDATDGDSDSDDDGDRYRGRRKRNKYKQQTDNLRERAFRQKNRDFFADML